MCAYPCLNQIHVMLIFSGQHGVWHIVGAQHFLVEQVIKWQNWRQGPQLHYCFLPSIVTAFADGDVNNVRAECPICQMARGER